MPQPFRLRTEIPLERDIHKAVANLLDNCLLAPAAWAPYPAGAAQLSPQQQAAYARVGLKRGWPDILIIYQGKTFGLELKRPGAELSRTRIGRTHSGAPRIYEGQKDVFPKLQAAGMVIGIARSVDEAIAVLQAWGIPLRVVT